MSHSYDVMAKTWNAMREYLPQQVKNSETAERFGFLIEAMHSANHELRDAVNKDRIVSAQASKLDESFYRDRAAWEGED